MLRRDRLVNLSEVQWAYREAIREGGASAEKLASRLREELPFPSPWWFPDIWCSLICVSQGDPALISPDRFEEFSEYERKERPRLEWVRQKTFNPYSSDPDKSSRYVRGLEEAFQSTLALTEYGGETTSYLETVVPFLGQVLERAFDAGEESRFRRAVPALRRVLDRFACERCAPISPAVRNGLLAIRKSVEAYERTG